MHRYERGIYFLICLLACSMVACDKSHAEIRKGITDGPTTLTTTSQVHTLSFSEARKQLPVHLIRAQVLYYNATLGNLFVRDSTGGLYVDLRNRPTPKMGFGDLIEIRGLTGPGGYAPVVEQAQIRVVGRSIVPTPHKFGLDHLLTGVEDCQWVETEGIVRDAEESRKVTAYANQDASGADTLLVKVATGIGSLDVIVTEHDGLDYKQLIDAKVAVRGVMGPRFNEERQLTGVHMFAQSLAQFRVLEWGSPHPFALPIRQINTVMRYEPGVEPEHRIRIRGVVTANTGQLLSIAEHGHGMFVRAADASGVTVGDLLDVVGFPAMGGYTPVLEDVTYRKVGRSQLPNPLHLSPDELFTGRADASGVRVQGVLLKHVRTLQEYRLLIGEGDRTFTALMSAVNQDSMSPLRDGSTLELTGTLQVEVNPNKTPRAILLLLRSPADVRVLRSGPWWSAERAMEAVGILSIIMLIALAWIRILRLKVARQKSALVKAQEESVAISELARAMQEVAHRRNFGARVPAMFSERIAQLAVGFNEMLSELEKGEAAQRVAEQKLELQALTDDLTKLPNRRLFSDRLGQSLALAKRQESLLALLYIDLDGFKLVNDTLGHKAGDLLLIEVSRRLRERARDCDTLARLGGDEFMLVLNTVRSRDDAKCVASAILEAIKHEFLIDGQAVTISASVGVSIYPDDGDDADVLLQEADNAMYAAKREGKNQVRSFTVELGASVREKTTLENELRWAIARNEIYLEFQPEYDIVQERLLRFEALARWKHPVLGMIPPSKFIPLAEETGLIHALGRHVMNLACREAAHWPNLHGMPIQLAVNVSSLQFADPGFEHEIRDVLHETGLESNRLQIELTESVMLNGSDLAAGTMQRLRASGVSIAIDDFGTGYSCLGYLPKLPFTSLKIDRSFVRELDACAGSRAIVSALVTLAENLGIKVIAEGIETIRQLKTVRALGITEAQGFLLGRPDADPEAVIREGGAVLRPPQVLPPDAGTAFALAAATQESGTRK